MPAAPHQWMKTIVNQFGGATEEAIDRMLQEHELEGQDQPTYNVWTAMVEGSARRAWKGHNQPIAGLAGVADDLRLAIPAWDWNGVDDRPICACPHPCMFKRKKKRKKVCSTGPCFEGDHTNSEFLQKYCQNTFKFLAIITLQDLRRMSMEPDPLVYLQSNTRCCFVFKRKEPRVSPEMIFDMEKPLVSTVSLRLHIYILIFPLSSVQLH